MNRRELLKFIGLASVGGLVALPTMSHADVLAEQHTAENALKFEPHPGGRYAPQTLAEILEDCREELPDGVNFFRDGAGAICSPVYGIDGGISSMSIAYLVSATMTHSGGRQNWYGEPDLGRGTGTAWDMIRTPIEFTFFDFAVIEDPRSAEQIVRHKVKAALTEHLAKCA